MNAQLTDFIEYFKTKMPKHDKDKARKETINHFRMTKDRTVYYTDYLQYDFVIQRKVHFQTRYLPCQNYKNLIVSPFL